MEIVSFGEPSTPQRSGLFSSLSYQSIAYTSREKECSLFSNSVRFFLSLQSFFCYVIPILPLLGKINLVIISLLSK